MHRCPDAPESECLGLRTEWLKCTLTTGTAQHLTVDTGEQAQGEDGPLEVPHLLTV